MRITEIVLGLAGPAAPTTLSVEPHRSGTTIIPLPEDAPPAELIARAIRETMGASERSTLTTEVPFVRVTFEDDSVEIAIADDAARGERMLTESRPREAPLLIECSRASRRAHERERASEAILARLSLAAGTDDESLLLAALASLESRSPAPEASDLEIAYMEALRRASKLSQAVRLLDRRMTASVVPDWLWVATGAGGIGVFMTVVALLYPHLRIVVVGFLVLLSIVGFAAYGMRSLGELRTRGLLLAERRALRERRESARAEARARAEELRVRGLDPDEVSSRLIGAPPDVPAVVGGRSAFSQTLASSPPSRQVILLTAASGLADGVDPRFVKWPSRTDNIA